ncbi:MAG: hypothetical protein JWL86_804 [Rhizobium sp.]|nr:hypothetical protein [Rhizobium sp.]
MNVDKIAEQAAAIRRQLVSAKPHSRKRIELEIRLRDLVLQQLRAETRKSKRAA